MEKNETKQTKTQVFNVIILDKSGSMGSIREAAVDGFNETLVGVKKAQEKFADTQEHFVSLLTFLCDSTRHDGGDGKGQQHPLEFLLASGSL